MVVYIVVVKELEVVVVSRITYRISSNRSREFITDK